MPKIILLLLCCFIGFFAYRWIRKQYQKNSRHTAIKLTMALVVAGLLVLAATGKIHWVGAALASFIAALRFALPMLIKSLPLIARLFGQRQQANKSQNDTPISSTEMSKQEAMDVLGLSKEQLNEEAIIQAHRSLIQKVHPDRGGNAHLAQRVNLAKDCLLKQLS